MKRQKMKQAITITRNAIVLLNLHTTVVLKKRNEIN